MREYTQNVKYLYKILNLLKIIKTRNKLEIIFINLFEGLASVNQDHQDVFQKSDQLSDYTLKTNVQQNDERQERQEDGENIFPHTEEEENITHLVTKKRRHQAEVGDRSIENPRGNTTQKNRGEKIVISKYRKLSVKPMAKRRKVEATYIPSRKTWTSEGWNYIPSEQDSDDSDEFSRQVNPDDQEIIQHLWKTEKENRRKKTVYHPVASPSTFLMDEEPLTIYGSSHSAMKKDPKEMIKSIEQGWNSSDDTTPDPSDSRLHVEFSPNLDENEMEKEGYIEDPKKNIDSTYKEHFDSQKKYHSRYFQKKKTQDKNKALEDASIKDRKVQDRSQYRCDSTTEIRYKEVQRNNDSHLTSMDIESYQNAEQPEHGNNIAHTDFKKEFHEIKIMGILSPIPEEDDDQNCSIEVMKQPDDAMHDTYEDTIDEAIQKIRNILQTNDEENCGRNTIIDKCIQAINKITINNNTDEDPDEINFSIENTEQNDYTPNKERKQIPPQDGQTENNTEDRNIDDSYSIDENPMATENEANKFRMSKVAIQKKKWKKSNGNDHKEAKKRTSSHSSVKQRSKYRKFPTKKNTRNDEINNSKMKRLVVNSSKKKKQRKFAAVTPRTNEEDDYQRKTLSIQTEVSFDTKKRGNSKWIFLTEEDEEQQSMMATPMRRDAPFRNKATQTSRIQIIPKQKKNKVSSKQHTEKTERRPKTDLKKKKILNDKKKKRKIIPPPQQVPVYDTSDSDNELTDPTFERRLRLPIEQRKLPARNRFPPQHFGIQLPSWEILDKDTIEGSEEEIRNLEQIKEKLKKEEHEKKKKRAEARRLLRHLNRTVATQTEDDRSTDERSNNNNNNDLQAYGNPRRRPSTKEAENLSSENSPKRSRKTPSTYKGLTNDVTDSQQHDDNNYSNELRYPYMVTENDTNSEVGTKSVEVQILKYFGVPL